MASAFLETVGRGRSRPEETPALCFLMYLMGPNLEWSLRASRMPRNCSLLLASTLLMVVCCLFHRDLGSYSQVVVPPRVAKSYCVLIVHALVIMLTHYVISAQHHLLTLYPYSVVVGPKGIARLALACTVSSKVRIQTTAGSRAWGPSLPLCICWYSFRESF